MIKSIKSGKIESAIFITVFFSIIFFFNYQSLFFLQPRSFHIIRQTDTLSFINYYLKTGLNFFDIGNLNLYNGSGKTACEFPVFYYLVALLSFTGIKSYLILKFLYLLIYLGTSYIIFIFLRKRFNLSDSLSLTFLLFSSTIVIYYTLNYIPNYPALCFTLCGLVYFLNYLDNQNNKHLIIGLIFFLLASLLKITFAIYPIGCFLLILLSFFKEKKIAYKDFYYFISVFIILLIWNLFVIYYNQLNQADYYLTSTKPIWDTTQYEKNEVFSFIFNYWLYKYYYHSTIHVFFILVFLSFFFVKKMDKKQALLSIIFFLGVSSYFILFFKNFRDHDYYFLEFVPFLFIVFINSFRSISLNINPKLKLFFSIALLTISILSINYGKLNLERRYEKPFEQVSRLAYELEEIEEKIDSLKIPDNAKILAIPDKSMNISLYYTNRFGYTVEDSTSQNLTKYYQKSDYILITDSNFTLTLEKKFNLNKSILSYRGSKLYKIQH